MPNLQELRQSRDHAFKSRKASRERSNKLFLGFVTGLSWTISALIVAVLLTILVRGAPAINWQFLTAPPIEGMSAGGIGPMIRGTLLLMLGTFLIVFPLGILGGIYLAEYAGRHKWVSVAKGLVTSLAGTPSIIFGLFGLAVFVLWFKELGWTQGSSLLAGWLTLGLMALPVIVLSTEAAMREVPDSLMDGGIALGLTKWQTIWRLALPYALPGIMTGLVVSVGRVAGEAPPILLTAGIYYVSEQPQGLRDTIFSPTMNLSYHLAEGYRQGGAIPQTIIWGTCLVLMITILILTLGAVWVRAWARNKRTA